MDDPFASDPFMDLVAGATGKLYPSRGSLLWADRLVKEYGMEMTVKAIERAIGDERVEPHQVLSAAEQLLEFARAKQEIIMDEEKEAEVSQARKDRASEQLAYLKKMADTSAAPRPLSELMPDVKLKP